MTHKNYADPIRLWLELDRWRVRLRRARILLKITWISDDPRRRPRGSAKAKISMNSFNWKITSYYMICYVIHHYVYVMNHYVSDNWWLLIITYLLRNLLFCIYYLIYHYVSVTIFIILYLLRNWLLRISYVIYHYASVTLFIILYLSRNWSLRICYVFYHYISFT